MKELSIEEKAKRYDKALERANKLKETCDSNAVVGWMEYIFPELKESGDIRKRIIDALHGDILEMGEIKKAIAWLEKQGNLMKALQISNAKIGELIEKNYYLKEQLEKQGNNMGISEVTKQELEDNLNNALEKETPESCNEFLDEQGSKEENLKERNICDTCEDSNGCLIPCCAKLLEKQGGQKSAEWSEKGEDTLHCIIDALDSLDIRTNTNGEHEDHTEEIYWLKSIKDRVQPQPKQEWSGADEAHLHSLITHLEQWIERHHNTTGADIQGENIAWLKSLKERYTWKPSDEQFAALRIAIGDEQGSDCCDILRSLLKDLKSL